MNATVKFTAPRDGALAKVVEVEIVFEGGPLDGTKLVGFSLWRNDEGRRWVTMPARAFGTGNARRYFDFLRATDDGARETGPVKAVERWIIEEWDRAAALADATREY